MKLVPLSTRRAHDAASTDAVELVLIVFDHPTLDAPVRLSTDPTERLSDEPLLYGTRSTWMGADPSTSPFLFVAASAALPTDGEDGQMPGEIILDALDVKIAETLRSFTSLATVHMAVVLASDPDTPSVELTNLSLLSASGDADHVSLQISRRPIEDETVPYGRFTKSSFPALFR